MHLAVPARRRRTPAAVALVSALVIALAPLAPAAAVEATVEFDPRPGHIVVTVTDERTDAPLPDAEVALHPVDWDGLAAPLATVATDPDGRADLDGTLDAPAGPYAIRVSAAGHETRWAADAPDLALATAYAFDATAGQAVAVALPPLKGAVTGAVVAAETGEPLHWAEVCAAAAGEDGTLPDVWSCRWSNAEGAFTLPVHAGTYVVRVRAAERAAHLLAAPVVVEAGQTVDTGEIPLELLPELVPTAPATVSTATPVVGSPVTVTLPTFADPSVHTTVAWFAGERRKPVDATVSFVPARQYAGAVLRVALVSTLPGHRTRTQEILVGTVTGPRGPVTKPVKPVKPEKPAKPAKPAKPGKPEKPGKPRHAAPVVQAPAPVAAARIGSVAKVSAPVVAAGSTVSYQWLADGKPVKRTTRPAYRIGPRLRGQAVAVRVTVTKPGHASYVKVLPLGRAR